MLLILTVYVTDNTVFSNINNSNKTYNYPLNTIIILKTYYNNKQLHNQVRSIY